MKVKIFFWQFPNPWTLRVSGMGGYTSKCEKKSKSLHPNVYITSQYFFPAIIYRDIISHITITYRYIMYFFRTFKKSTAPYKVHNMGLRYIKSNMMGL
jgi:hypothetical protein